MAIVYPYNPPASGPSPASVEISIMSNNAMTESIFSKQQRIYERNVARWRISVSLPPMTRPQASEWTAWALALNGRAGTFRYGLGTHGLPRGVAAGSPALRVAASAGDKTVEVEGWTSASGQLLPGDYIQLGDYVYQNLTRADASGLGRTTLDIFPAMKQSLPVGAPVTTSYPTSLWRMESDEVTWSISPGDINIIGFSAVEAF